MKSEREIWTREYIVRVTAYRAESALVPKPPDTEPEKPEKPKRTFWDEELADFLDDYS